MGIGIRASALALAAFIAGCGASGEDAARTASAPKVNVEVATVVPAAPDGLVRLSGTIGFVREPALSFRANGVIQAIAVDEGDVVKRGQRLAWLRPTDVAADAAQARAALQVAERNLSRTRTLFDRGFVAQARLDDAELAFERARAAFDSAAFTAETAEIRAPSDGVILRRLADPNQVAAVGAPILTLAETRSGVVARGAAPAAAARRIRAGDSARVLIGAETFQGKVLRVSGQGDAATGGVDIEVALDQPGGLRSGQIVDMEVDARPALGGAGALKIPPLALLDARADQGVVLVVEADGVARRRAVRTAGVVGDNVLVLEGLKSGERIVSRGAAYVRDGEAVAIVQAQR